MFVRRRSYPLLALSCVLGVGVLAAEKPEPPKPDSRTNRQIEGWTVRVDDRLLAPPHEVLGARVLKLLEAKLADITYVVPKERLEKLQAVTIVLDLTHGKLRAMQYHPDAGWLEEHGYARDLAKCVHIPEAADLPTRRNIQEQPWVVLHELAHAYHDQVLGFDEPRIREAYKRFKKSGHGDAALLFNGKRVRHYGLTDHKEFFAEMTEAYFGMNDFFPFNRAELMTAEPELYELLRTIWEPETPADAGKSPVPAAGASPAAAQPAASDPATVLYYAQPAEKWSEALPVGNGRLGAIVFGGITPATTDRQPKSHELIRDPHFRTGFRLIEPKPGQRVVDGRLAGSAGDAEPAWDLDQWSSRFPLVAETLVVPQPGVRRWANAAKVVTVGAAGTAEADLSLAVNATVEYGKRARKSGGEPWVHLLVEQYFADPPSLTALTSARLRLKARLLQSEFLRTDEYSPGLHAAQFQLFLMLQNRNRQSPGFGKLVWFGIPIYDDRSRFPKEHKAQDFGGTAMFIFTPGGEVFADRSAHDRDWITIDKDLRPLFVESLETAWQRGFLRESRDLADYRITGMNLGWEVPGLFDVAVQMRDLSLEVELVD